MQTTNHILMIRPVDFKYNEQTAGNNKFQIATEQNEVQKKALEEFDQFVETLRKNGVDVTVIDDTLEPSTPDSIFPNNWISFHEDGSVYLYPMFSPNRRGERRNDILDNLANNFELNHIADISFYEKQNIFLEGTGSMVLDRENKIAYACLSVRTDAEVLDNFCMITGYRPVSFHAVDQSGYPIYHTNVMMCVADKYVVICSESIADDHEREYVLNQIKNTGKEIIEINYEQMNHFAGNMLQIRNAKDEPLLVMSEQALKALTKEQVAKLEAYNRIISSPLYTIEQNGGGSARCMLAEIHLPKR
ncbi:citrulline utilization hydrolase CtlX [Pedobacter montanisoli]|uniref:Arginine deiminase-related protein n=1 Tax=Pedobacter montanisoli TaxID=2923277 RepID=A0ABS9ZYP9_9SPHI|nr:arginine deiminase-related protein [Pedobacter montanisoli]MCJ0743427.1 arginine deiminase-related protein [Pedobacter montanisoli]